jgi:serine/threonine protein kinase
MADLEVRSIKLTEIALDPGDPLGQGAFGRVHAGTWLTRNMRVAVKFLHTDEHAFNAEEVEAFKREISLHFKLRSPNIVVVYGCIIDETTRPKPTYAVVMDLMESSVYKRYVQTSAKADMRTLLRVLHQLAVGMCYLHAGGIMHLDIKSLNALLDENGNAKWTDFGLRQVIQVAIIFQMKVLLARKIIKNGCSLQPNKGGC